MIEMRVRNQNEVNRGNISQANPGLAQSLEQEKPGREVGVDQHVLIAHLQKKTGVANECNAQLPRFCWNRQMWPSGARRYHGVPDNFPQESSAATEPRLFRSSI